MRHTLGAILIVAFGAALAPAAEKSGCTTSRETVIKAANERECPDELKEAEAMTCADAVKDARRLYELIKTCTAKPKKGAGSTAPKPVADSKPAVAAAPANSDLPAGKYKCRSVDAGGKVIAATGSEASQVECISAMKKLIAAARCDGSSKEIEYTYQSYKDEGTWTKGVPASARCK